MSKLSSASDDAADRVLSSALTRSDEEDMESKEDRSLWVTRDWLFPLYFRELLSSALVLAAALLMMMSRGKHFVMKSGQKGKSLPLVRINEITMERGNVDGAKRT